MSSIVEHVELPGIGIRSVFSTSTGQQVGVLGHTSGQKDVLVYAKEDPDRCADVMTLDAAEAQVMADLLGMAPLGAVADRLLIGGLTVTWFEIAAGWWAVGQHLPVSVSGLTWLGVVRDGTVLTPSSDPSLDAADVIVVAGESNALESAVSILKSGP